VVGSPNVGGLVEVYEPLTWAGPINGKEAIDIRTRVRVAIVVSGSLNFVDLRLSSSIGLNAALFCYSSAVYTGLLLGLSYNISARMK
jgi:hypothetical protein